MRCIRLLSACCALLAAALAPSSWAGISEQDFHPFDPKQAELGRLLFYDPILSGNQNIACATCHHHDFGSADGLALGVGEGGIGLGPERNTGSGASRIKKRIPRNAPALWNLGALEVKVLFHDGRLSFGEQYGNGFVSPAEERLPEGLDGLLAAQALLPLAAQFEMAGNPKENEVAGALHDRIDYVWPIISARVRAVDEYAELFLAAFPELERREQISIVPIVNAIAAFINSEWRSFDSAYDRWLAGDKQALSAQADHGRELFFGAAACSSCHSGAFFSDQQFHALGLPHFGPGRTRVFDPMVRDLGHMGVSNRVEDAYRFRTPQLRNVALTAPYGHNGAYPDLEGIIRHHLDPAQAFAAWRPELVRLPRADWLTAVDFIALKDERERSRLAAKLDLSPIELEQSEVDALVAFMHALTGGDSTQGRLGQPTRVPSGLPVGGVE